MTISIFDQFLSAFFRNRPGLKRLLLDVRAEIEARHICQASRKELLQLDENQLRDIGIARKDAIKEGNRGFWD